MFKSVIALRDRSPIECVCLNDVSTSLEVGFVDSLNDMRLRETEEIVVVLEKFLYVFKEFAYANEK